MESCDTNRDLSPSTHAHTQARRHIQDTPRHTRETPADRAVAQPLQFELAIVFFHRPARRAALQRELFAPVVGEVVFY